MWCHAKNFEALEYLTRCAAHCFYHQEDDYTITSRGFIWAYPGQPGGRYTIAVHPERLKPEELKVYNDYPKGKPDELIGIEFDLERLGEDI